MKKRTITLIVLLAILVILAALVCIGLVKSAEAHDAVYADYDAAVSAVEGAALAVIENGSTVGTYSLADLGVRDATLAAASAPYSAVDRMDADAFARCSIKTRLEYLRAATPNRSRWRSSPTGSTQAKSCPTCTPSAAPPPPTRTSNSRTEHTRSFRRHREAKLTTRRSPPRSLPPCQRKPCRICAELQPNRRRQRSSSMKHYT